MPYKSEKIKIANTKFDRRIKLTELQRADIRSNFGGLSMRKLALMYNVDRKTIAYIMYPERYEKSLKDSKERNAGGKYYSKEKQREYIINQNNLRKNSSYSREK